MKTKIKIKTFFNLVEVTLAIAVAGIGLAGIMALFPIGLNSNRDAIGEAYAAESAEQFLSLMERLVNSSQQAWFLYIQSKFDYNEFSICNYGDNPSRNGCGFYSIDNAVESATFFYTDTSTIQIEREAGFQDTDADTSLKDALGIDEAENIYQNFDDKYRPGLYRITQGTGNYIDFDAIIRVWKSNIKIPTGTGTNDYYKLPYGYDGEPCYGVVLHTEISWPRTLPYYARNKRYFSKEIFYSADY